MVELLADIETDPDLDLSKAMLRPPVLRAHRLVREVGQDDPSGTCRHSPYESAIECMSLREAFAPGAAGGNNPQGLQATEGKSDMLAEPDLRSCPVV